jgi:hypothetical protein
MIVLTLNRPHPAKRQLRLIWEFNPHYRGRRLWRLWQFLPYVVVNAWIV